MGSVEQEEQIEELRQLCNKHGVPNLFNELCEYLGWDGDYVTDDSEEMSDTDDDDIVGEYISVEQDGDFYTMKDCKALPKKS